MPPAIKDEESHSTQLNSINKDSEIWLEDGTLVVLVGGTHAFRVYKGLLARASTKIRELKMCYPDTEPIEGCPVVPFYHDSPTDVRHFLHTVTLAGPSYVLHPCDCTLSLS